MGFPKKCQPLVRAVNLTVPVGSGQTISGTGRVRASVLSPCRPLVRALNLTVPLGSGRVGSDDLGYGPGSGFSFEPVQTSSSGSKFNCAARVGSGQTISGTGRVRASVLSPCRPLVWIRADSSVSGYPGLSPKTFIH